MLSSPFSCMLTVHCCRYRSGDLAAKTANEMTYTVLGWSI